MQHVLFPAFSYLKQVLLETVVIIKEIKRKFNQRPMKVEIQ